MLRRYTVEGKKLEFYGHYSEDFDKLPRNYTVVWNGSYFLDLETMDIYFYSDKVQDWIKG